MATPAEEDRERFKNIDPNLREEVGGLLERAFKREEGRAPDELESYSLEVLAGEAEQKASEAERQAIEAAQAARGASERYAASHSLDDLEQAQRWEAEVASFRREAENYRLEAERLRKYL
jgi:hypothetical protein